MKKIKSLLILTAILALPLIYFTACSNKSEINEPNQVNFDSPTMAIIDFNDAQNGIEDATLETGMTLSPSLFSYSFINDKNFTHGNVPMMGMVAGNMWMGRFDWGKHLGLFFRRLNLSDQQKSDLKALMVKFHDDMKPLVQQFRDANADIIKAANEARKLIVEDVKAGKITRQEAAAKLKALNEDTRKKINDNPATQTVKASMCTLRKNLINSITGMFTGDQLIKWKAFVLLISNPC
ncbi:MAG: hypothetical protein WC879_01370 [Melioribacteraceae bacterium]